MKISNKESDNFVLLTKNIFNFLEKDFLCHFDEVVEKGYYDTEIQVRYIGKVGIIIIYYISEAYITVRLCELNNGQFFESYSNYGFNDFPKAIDLEYLVEWETKQKDSTPLKQSTHKDSIKKIEKLFYQRKTMIEDEFKNILMWYADMLKEYGSDILLKGDLSKFSIVQEFTMEISEIDINGFPLKPTDS